ncbi:MAG: DNA-binding protein WhiA [Peptoniphilaceae bacterium]|nr:DNA-binding protein WhiA [Peptoniphilaceae bacterium]
MSFSKRCKKEVLKNETNDKFVEAELVCYLYFVGSVRIYNNKYQIVFKTTENNEARAIYKLIKRLYKYSPAIGIQKKQKFSSDRNFNVIIEDENIAFKILSLRDKYQFEDHDKLIKTFKNISQRKIFLKVAFILKGSINDPNRGYNLEIYGNKEEAELVKDFMDFFNLNPKINIRRDDHVVYLKDSDKISDFLALIGANRSLLDLENVKAMKSLRNEVNRKTNFDYANINRTVNASIRQVEAINHVKKAGKFDQLSYDLKEIAELRLKNPHMSLEELGELLNPPLSKAKVNYRLQKFIKMAEDL